MIAIAAHKLMSTLTPASSGREKQLNKMMVRITATKEMEQPTMEMISRASLWLPFSCDMYKIWLLAASMLLKALFYKPNTTLNFQEKRRWIDFAAIPFLERF